MRPGINAADIVTAAERLRHEGRSISTVAVREKLCLCYRTRTFRALPAADAKTFHDNQGAYCDLVAFLGHASSSSRRHGTATARRSALRKAASKVMTWLAPWACASASTNASPKSILPWRKISSASPTMALLAKLTPSLSRR